MIRPMLWLLACGVVCTGSVAAQETDLRKQAMKVHQAAGGTYCERVEGAFVPEGDYEEWTFDYQPSWSEDEADKETVTLIRIFCAAGAYNVTDAYYMNREYEGLMPVSFAQPSFETKYEGDDISIDGKLLSVTVTGFNATTLLVNSAFDPETLTITNLSLWRGLGDASSGGKWVFSDGEFVLKQFDIDASYDDEMNPETVVQY